VESWTAESLTALFLDRGIARMIHQRSGTLFVPAEPLPQTGRPGEPIHPSTPCLAWVGPVDHNGYGKVGIKGRTRSVHVVTHELVHGHATDRLMRGHACERRLCADPDHLRLLTNRANGLEGAGRRYPDQLISMAPSVPCRACAGPTVATVHLRRSETGQPPRWALTCWRCRAPYKRGEAAWPGMQYRQMSAVAQALLAELLATRDQAPTGA